MDIDASKLQEIYPYGINRRVDKHERFYLIEQDKRYALSDHGQLVAFSTDKNKWQSVKREFVNNKESFLVYWAGAKDAERVTLEQLFLRVFFPEVQAYRLIIQPDYPRKGKTDRWSYDVLKAHILFDRDQLIEYIDAKCNHRKPTYPEIQYQHHFINRDEHFTNYLAYMTFSNANQRARDPKRKAKRKDNTENTISEEWHKPIVMLNWIYQNRYFYSGRHGELQLDKDLLSLCESKEYSAKNCCFIPAKLNQLIRRKPKNKRTAAEQILAIVNDERKRNQIPDYILEKAVSIARLYLSEEVDLLS